MPPLDTVKLQSTLLPASAPVAPAVIDFTTVRLGSPTRTVGLVGATAVMVAAALFGSWYSAAALLTSVTLFWLARALATVAV